MANAERVVGTFGPSNVLTDANGNRYVQFTHGLGRSYPTVQVWQEPGGILLSNPGRVVNVNTNVIKLYLNGAGIHAGNQLKIRVVG